MTKYRGLFGDCFLDTEAADEDEAQAKMKAELLRRIQADPEPFIVWDTDDGEFEDDCAGPAG